MTEPLRKRRLRLLWLLSVAVLLAIAYPASYGPAQYAVIRGWLPSGWFHGAYAAAQPLSQSLGLNRYNRWWLILAVRHTGGEVIEFDDGRIAVRAVR